MQDIKIILLCDQFLLEQGIKTLINKVDGFSLIAEIKHTKDLKTACQQQPDVLICGLSELTEMQIEEITESNETHLNMHIMYVGNQSERQSVFRALQLKPHSYVLTECDEQEIIDAIIAAQNGTHFICEKVLTAFKGENGIQFQEGQKKKCSPVELSEREIEIVQLIAREFSSKDIAEHLFLSEHTVRTHRKNIMNKIGTNNTVGIVMHAIRNGYVQAAAQ